MDPAPLASSRHIGEFRHDRARPFLHVIAEMRTRRCSSPCGNPTIRDGRSSRTYAPHVAHARTGLPVRVNAPPSSNRSDMPPPLSRYMDDRKAPSSCLSIVTQLKDFGLCVIAHEFGVATWPVATRCRVLLAGARYLLDGQSPDFQEALLATLRDLLVALQELRDEKSRIRELACTHGIVGHSEALLAAFRNLVRMSKLSDLPVLITGESGTGKELFASALHALDPKRCQRPFVAVNCAAINAGVAESELFGHVRGAFTGASHDHSGLFLAAQGGVLFLDEIGELNPDVQAKILRVLQEKRLFRVGAGKDAPIDVRIVAATNQDLAQMMNDGRFRPDLFHRLNSLSILISPLRERVADLPLLVEHFVSAHQPRRDLSGIDRDLRSFRHAETRARPNRTSK